MKNRPDRFKDVMHIKHITPTHWTWVTYDAKEMKVMATAGGTWVDSGGGLIWPTTLVPPP